MNTIANWGYIGWPLLALTLILLPLVLRSLVQIVVHQSHAGFHPECALCRPQLTNQALTARLCISAAAYCLTGAIIAWIWVDDPLAHELLPAQALLFAIPAILMRHKLNERKS